MQNERYPPQNSGRYRDLIKNIFVTRNIQLLVGQNIMDVASAENAQTMLGSLRSAQKFIYRLRNYVSHFSCKRNFL